MLQVKKQWNYQQLQREVDKFFQILLHALRETTAKPSA